MGKMEYEYKFLNMMGYKIKPLYESRWNVFDENDNIVGFIQRKKMINKNKKKALPAVFGYIMEIESDTISYKSKRQFNCETNAFNYQFDIKRENGESDHVDMNCGEFPNITIWSHKYGYMQFHIHYDGLFANFKSRTENFNLEEIIIFKGGENENNCRKEYVYQIGYSDKKIELSDENSNGRTTREICIKSNSYQQDCNQVRVIERTWISGNLRDNRENIVKGTIEEAVTKHQMGIDALSHLRYILNSILPFKQEIMDAMLTNTSFIKEAGIEYFFPDIIEQLRKTPCLDCKDKRSCDKSKIMEKNYKI